MKQSEAWVTQAASDLAAGKRLYQKGDATTYCQALSKYQQTVEKSVKAMVAAVNDLGVHFMSVTPSHVPTREIDALLVLRRAIDNVSVDRLAEIFKKYRKPVEDLCRLAPKWPDDGYTFARNTEYPFQVGAGWAAPALPDSFTEEETETAQRTAWAFHHAAADFVRGVRLGRL